MSFLAHSLMRLAVVLLTAGAIGVVVYTISLEQIEANQCENRLHRLYSALEQYEIDRGMLPHVAFFPDDPKQDSDSLPTALAAYVAGPEIYICPATPKLFQDTGLTYVWNVELNGKKLRDSKEPVWILTEINALSDQVPAPHWRRYHILYTDGSVRHSRTPPKSLN
ncbi:MAG: hypothetical protein A2X46_04625 [Lentisphaerae bacterium GWF2_57_35]|nr:MAG: hypothetical protein A2X46_04625 [Lentisphaerae bacterium GWF2_57_35]